jgi:hypothetical protein
MIELWVPKEGTSDRLWKVTIYTSTGAKVYSMDNFAKLIRNDIVLSSMS